MLGVSKSNNRIKCLHYLLLAVVCLCASETCGYGNQPLKLCAPLAEIIRNGGGCVSEARNLALVELGECAARMMSICGLGTQLVHEGTKLSQPIAPPALSFSTQSKPMIGESGDKTADNARTNKASQINKWVYVAQKIINVVLCGEAGGVIGAYIYSRLLTPTARVTDPAPLATE